MTLSTTTPRRWQVLGTIAILGLSVVALGLGFLRAGHYRDAPYHLAQIFGQDVVTLVVGLPLLAVGLWYATHGSVRGYIVWLGALGYMLYTWASYALMLYFNEFFLGYVALFGLSLYVFVGALVDLDARSVSQRIDDRLPRRLVVVYLLAMGAFIALGWLADIVPATLSGGVPEAVQLAQVPTSVIYALDLAILLPAVVIVAAWLRAGRPWGAVFTGVLLVKFATLGLAVMAMEAWAWNTGQGGSLAGIAMFGFIAGVSLVLGVAFLRSVGPTARPGPTSRSGPQDGVTGP